MLPGESPANEGSLPLILPLRDQVLSSDQNPYELRPHAPLGFQRDRGPLEPFYSMGSTPPAGLARFPPSRPILNKISSEHESQIFPPTSAVQGIRIEPLSIPPSEVVNGSFVSASLDKTTTEHGPDVRLRDGLPGSLIALRTRVCGRFLRGCHR